MDWSSFLWGFVAGEWLILSGLFLGAWLARRHYQRKARIWDDRREYRIRRWRAALHSQFPTLRSWRVSDA